MRVLPTIVTSILIFVFSVIVTAQVIPGEGTDSGLGGQNIISGSVFLTSGERVLRRVQVRLESSMRGNRITMTDDKGNFVLRGVPNGSYLIVVDKEVDFEPFTYPLEVVVLRGSPAQTFMVGIKLKPKSTVPAKADVINAEFAGVPKDALDRYAKGTDLASKRDVAGAIEAFKSAIAAYPEFTHAFNELGVQYMRLGEFDKADAAFRDALRLKPDSFTPMINRGMLLVTMKRYADAEPVLNQAVKIEPKSVPARFFWGQALANLGRFDEAEKELSSALTAGGSTMAEAMKEGHRILAIIYSTRGDKKRQLAELEAYVKLAPNAADITTLQELIRQLKNQ